MSYTPTQWQTGDTIIANKLNNIENGLENISNPLLVTITPTNLDFSGTMNKTANEITAAQKAGKQVIFHVVGFPGFDGVDIPVGWYTYATGDTLCAACANLIDITSSIQISIFTSNLDSDTRYYTQIYPLTGTSNEPLIVSAMFNKTKSEEVGYEFYSDCDKTIEDISAAYLAGQNIRVLLYSEWAKNDSDEYVHLDTAQFCKGMDVLTTYSSFSTTLILVDESYGNNFLSSTTGSTTAQVEALNDYLPRAD